MDSRVVLVCLVLIVLAGQEVARADFLYNHNPLESPGIKLKCKPGRTVIKIEEKADAPIPAPDSSGEDDNTRRSHMRFTTEDEACQMCVCSAEGKDEYCSKRPAMNVNECMRMGILIQQFSSNEPFSHERALSYMIRRDLIWHKDEIPYDKSAKCYRGSSYYSNSPKANDTDIAEHSDVGSVLNYADTSICFFCICNVQGDAAGCIHRSPWYCNYFRHLRDPNAPRDRYKHLFQQDRPAYFRMISYRLRRAMDVGMFDLIDSGGDSLCCGHPNGHRRHIHHQVKNKIRLLKNRVNRENLMGGPSGGDYVDFIVNNDKKKKLGQDQQTQKCVPFVSTYTNCNDENLCDGCVKCTCSAAGEWVCQEVHQCKPQPEPEVKDEDLDVAVEMMINSLNERRLIDIKNSDTPNVPQPSEYDRILEEQETPDNSEEVKQEDDILSFMIRRKRSVEAEPIMTDNQTVTFHHTIDEINEDTLKNSNSSGTITANKLDATPTASGRPTSVDNSTISKALQIEFTPPLANHHASDNKIDTTALHDDHLDLMVHHKLYEMAGNESLAARDKKISKLVVNELKGGAETIGDKESQVISNITFTSENDTMTAMAFIAGNLLNKIWNMEKDANENSLETESMKHKKINDLLELFKEPLNLRQESFLKNALEQLATAMEKKETDNITLCKKIEDLKQTPNFRTESKKALEDEKNNKEGHDSNINSEVDQKNELSSTAEALSKIGNVLELIKKYERVQNALSDVKSDLVTKTIPSNYANPTKHLTKDEKTTFNVFGNILKKLTKLLMPNKKAKKMVKQLKGQSILSSDYAFEDKIKTLNIFNVSEMSGTVKDRIVLDYLSHMQTNPGCLLGKKNKKILSPDIEGDILLNLSEFFKIKSMSDLLKLLDSEKKDEDVALRRATTLQVSKPTESYTTTTTTTTTEKNIRETTIVIDSGSRFEVTKGKLKMHLKTILEDLMELQNINGKATKGKDIEIANALPCIYNLLNEKIESSNLSTRTSSKTSKHIKEDPASKIPQIFKNLKDELKRTSLTRRSNLGNLPRPKSAIVWERTIKNIGADLKSRRHMVSEPPKTLEEIKKMVDSLESADSNTYKAIAFSNDVPAAERLLLYKALTGDTKKYINALKDIQKSLETLSELKTEELINIEEFIDNVNLNINLNVKVIKKIQTSPKPYSSYITKPVEPVRDVNPFKRVVEFKSTPKEIEARAEEMPVTLTRDQIINQLIKNRMQYYLKSKDGAAARKGIDKDLAKKILFYLEIGNDALAREMYKLFVSQKNKTLRSAPDIKVTGKPLPSNHKLKSVTFKSLKPNTNIYSDPRNDETSNQYRANRRLANKVPLIQFDEPKLLKKTSWGNQDQLIKQLINIKNMRI